MITPEEFLYKIEELNSIQRSVDIKILKNAMNFTLYYHGNQSRRSGQPYYSHPLAVGLITTEMLFETKTIVAALLHDIVEDTSFTIQDVENNFGYEVANLVEGLSKINSVKLNNLEISNTENLTKLIFAITQDIRVLIIKLADRLHNMRTIDFLTRQTKKQQIAKETLQIYAKLAERIGIEEIKIELQDIAFKVLYPQKRLEIIYNILHTYQNFDHTIKVVIDKIQNFLSQYSIQGKVVGRKKSPYSIWTKIQRKNIDYNQLSDVLGFRIIVKTISDCYKILQILHSYYTAAPNSFKDFISTPKQNGYRSLHTKITNICKYNVEIQIRTKEMDQAAENGVAAHWIYKQKEYFIQKHEFLWIKNLQNVLLHNINPHKLISNSKIYIYYDQIFCYTVKGKVIPLPSGANVIDFACIAYPDLVVHAIRANVNDTERELDAILQNGDKIDLITSTTHKISNKWLNKVVTKNARKLIQEQIIIPAKLKNIELGEVTINNLCLNFEIKKTTGLIQRIISKTGSTDRIELYENLGNGNIPVSEVTSAILQYGHNLKFLLKKYFFKILCQDKSIAKYYVVCIENIDTKDQNITYAKCCLPILGDKIQGLFTLNKGITIHRNNCNILNYFVSVPRLLLKYKWNEYYKIPEHFLSSKLDIIIKATTTKSELYKDFDYLGVNILNSKQIFGDQDSIRILYNVRITDLVSLEGIITILKKKKYIISIKRY